ncbi:efflux RND transporter periplasmic adaptor subunit [Flavisphingomonas formosensis]|uniref:efflux RND transporter periplasmic adaptor subunit n=1 Tax=Flavisphingomonas formosensis TaxID=861534 RepID=UPI0012F7431C|nr:efflux RND transporter periplasmic adaptor subunit [Sphingomonas formosensis]
MNIEPGFSRERAELVDLPESDRRRRLRLTIIGAGILFVLVAAWLLMHRGSSEPTAQPAPPGVTYIVPGRTLVTNSVAATGTLAAKRDMPVGVAGEGGMIARVLVEPGDWVNAGQTMATIDTSVETQQAAQLAAQIRAAEANAELAQSNLDRALALVSRGFISKADLDSKRASRDAMRAQVSVARAQLGEMRARIGRLDIRSPKAGLVLTRMVEAGQVVNPTSGALFRVAENGELELRAQLSEGDLARMKVGDGATVTPVGSSRSFRGRIWQLSPIIDNQTRQGLARIALDYDPALRPGGFATAQLESGTVSAPVLPESAVQSDAKGNYVYVIDGGNVVRRRDVRIGQVSDQGIAILSGLTGDEHVVYSAGAFLNPGDKVTPSRVAAR